MTYTEEEKNLIVLNSFRELTYKGMVMLAGGFSGGAPDFVKNRDYLIKTFGGGVYNKVKEKFFSPDYRESVLSNLKEKQIICVTYVSEFYPEGLKDVPTPPIVLYCKGNISLLKTRCFAVVGSRRTPPDVLKTCESVASELTQRFTVVTGAADGADAAAIVGALKSGRIISILGHGFDFTYPSVNDGLLKRVERQGLLVTEYTPAVPPLSHNFPVRNRLIAGASEGTLVVSAGRKSGAAITAEYAFSYGRRVFAFPYSLGVSCGEGCNKLIKDGATLARNTLDIFDDFGLDFKQTEKKPLSPDEEKLLEVIKTGNGFVPHISEKFGKLPFQIIPLLTSLEMKGYVVRVGGNRYTALN